MYLSIHGDLITNHDRKENNHPMSTRHPTEVFEPKIQCIFHGAAHILHFWPIHGSSTERTKEPTSLVPSYSVKNAYTLDSPRQDPSTNGRAATSASPGDQPRGRCVRCATRRSQLGGHRLRAIEAEAETCGDHASAVSEKKLG